jgi:hypothetical protein
MGGGNIWGNMPHRSRPISNELHPARTVSGMGYAVFDRIPGRAYETEGHRFESCRARFGA